MRLAAMLPERHPSCGSRSAAGPRRRRFAPAAIAAPAQVEVRRVQIEAEADEHAGVGRLTSPTRSRRPASHRAPRPRPCSMSNCCGSVSSSSFGGMRNRSMGNVQFVDVEAGGHGCGRPAPSRSPSAAVRPRRRRGRAPGTSRRSSHGPKCAAIPTTAIGACDPVRVGQTLPTAIRRLWAGSRSIPRAAGARSRRRSRSR